MGSGDDTGDLAAGEWRRHRRLSRWELEMKLETKRLGTGDDVGDEASGDWRQLWRLSGWGVETMLEI